MCDYTACLNVAFKARDEDEAREILEVLAKALLCTQYKVEVESDDLEEA